MVYIDDVRLDEQLSISPALYYRRMSLFVSAALSELNKPPELLDYLNSGKVLPLFNDYYWTSTEASTIAPTEINTGLTGYDICSCVIVQSTDDGRIL